MLLVPAAGKCAGRANLACDEAFSSFPDLTLEEAAKRLNLSERTIQRRLKRGQLTGYKVDGDRGPEWRITLGESLDTKLKAIPTSDDTTVDTEVMTDTEAVSSEDTTPGVAVPNEQLFQHLRVFIKIKLRICKKN